MFYKRQIILVLSCFIPISLFLFIAFTKFAYTSVESQTFSVISFNIGTIDDNSQVDEVVKTIESNGDFDFILLQDVRGGIKLGVLAKALGYPYFETTKGIRILSRYPLYNSRVTPFPTLAPEYESPRMLCAETRIENSEMRICSVHLASPSRLFKMDDKKYKPGIKDVLTFLWIEMFGNNQRVESVNQIVELHEPSTATIIGGDFNTFPLSAAYRRMIATYDDAHWPSLDFLKESYNALQFLVKPRIDYVFHSKDFRRISSGVGDSSPGDHNPVMATLELKE